MTKLLQNRPTFSITLIPVSIFLTIGLLSLLNTINQENQQVSLLECNKNLSLSDFSIQNIFSYEYNEQYTHYSNLSGQILQVDTINKEYCLFEENGLVLFTPSYKIYSQEERDGSNTKLTMYAILHQTNEKKILYESDQFMNGGGLDGYIDFNQSKQWYSFSLSSNYMGISFERNISERALNPENTKGGLVVWDINNLDTIYTNTNIVFDQGGFIDNNFIFSYKGNIKNVDLYQNSLDDITEIAFEPVFAQQNNSLMLANASREDIIFLIKNNSESLELTYLSEMSLQKVLDLQKGYTRGILDTVRFVNRDENGDWIMVEGARQVDL